MTHRVWIELEKAGSGNTAKEKAEAIATNRTRAALATKMIERLGSPGKFWFFEDKWCFCHADSSGSYVELSNNGDWFNLEFFGRN